MILKSTFREGQDTFLGAAPSMWYGEDTIDGDAYPWKDAAVGSCYVQRNTSTDASLYIRWQKVVDNNDDSDWVGEGYLCEMDVLYTDFTDGGSTAGTCVLTYDIPVGALVTRTMYRNVVGFAGDTSATVELGDGTDADRFGAASDPSVFANAALIDGGAPQGTALVSTAVTSPTLTITSGSDWGSVSAGSLDVYVYFTVQK